MSEERTQNIIKALTMLSIANDRLFIDEKDLIALSSGDELSIIAKNTAGLFDRKVHLFSAATIIRAMKIFSEFDFQLTDDYIIISDKNSNSKFKIRLASATDVNAADEEADLNSARELFESISADLDKLNHIKIHLDSEKIKFILGLASQNKFQFVTFDYTEGSKEINIKMSNVSKTISYDGVLPIESGSMKSFKCIFNLAHLISGDWQMVFIENNDFIYFENDEYQYVVSIDKNVNE